MIALGYLAVVALLLANAFFVAAEFSIVTVDRTQLRRQVEQGSRRAKVAEAIIGRLSYSLSGAQIGITICSLALGILAEPVVAKSLESLVGGVVGDRRALGVAVALSLALTTIAQMVVGELVPKSVAVAKPLGISMATAPVFRVFSVLFKPVISFSNMVADALVGLFGVEPTDELSTVRSRRELRRLVETSEESGAITHSNAQLLDRTFRFGEKTAADALTPRVSVRSLALDATTGDLISLSQESGLSRFPVHGEGLDDILGVVHIKDVLGVPPAERDDYPIQGLLRPVLVVPETKELESLMVELQGADGQFALVVDEYGGTAGIITLEDLIEEIVGDIDDEHDYRPGVPTVRRWGGVHLVSGLLHPDEVSDACGFTVPDGDYETLGGFVLQQLDEIPSVGDRFEFDGWSVEVAKMEGRRVDSVKLTAPSPGTIAIESAGDE